MRFCLICLLLSSLWSAFAQGQSTPFTGQVVEQETSIPVVGALVKLFQDTALVEVQTTDYNGEFSMRVAAVGRYHLTVQMLGMQDYSIQALQLTTGKTTHVVVALIEDLVMANEVVIKANSREGSLNEMATVSAKQFDVQETDRYAGSRGDPARMASNFAGVVGADDSRNDIVIRGNSPQSVLWRLDGIDLPNPNHFNIPGTAGGPVSVINNKYLGNSDFYTGAFPAEYGNSTAGAFDLRMRNGLNSKHHGSAQFGFLGTELFLEGPIWTNSQRDTALRKPSYLVSYRYSTVQLFALLGIDIGTDAVPKYQDGAFRLHWPLKNNNNISVWGIAGKSNVDILISDQTSPDQRNIYGQNDRDQYFKSNMMALGFSWNKSIGLKTILRSNTAFTQDRVLAHHELVYRQLVNNVYQIDSFRPTLGYDFRQNKWTNHSSLLTKFNSHWIWRNGITTHWHNWTHQDSLYNNNEQRWNRRWNTKMTALQLQPYSQLKWKVNDKWTATAGLHVNTMAFFMPIAVIPDSIVYAKNSPQNHTSFEPRMSIRYECSKKSSLAIGVGRHSQTLAPYIYTYLLANDAQEYNAWNSSLDFTKSDHAVISWQYLPKQSLRLLIEAYYQRLYNIPVDQFSSSFSLINAGAGFSRVFPNILENSGTGQNTGVECTIEQFYHHGWLWLVSASLFDATYKGSDGVKRNVDFNNRFALNALVSKEWLIAKKTFLVIGTKITSTGGRWYGPADIEASNTEKELVFVDSLRNSVQFKNYFRWDLKINVKFNKSKTMHEIGLDLVNVLNTKNILSLTYAPDETNDPQKAIRPEYQLGFLPLFYYRLDF